MSRKLTEQEKQLQEFLAAPAPDVDDSTRPLDDDDGYGPDDEGHPEPDPPELTNETMRGFIFIAANPGLDNRIKLGRSVDPDTRLRPLNSAHDENFQVVTAFATDDPKRAKALCHEALKPWRVKDNKELFAISAAPVVERYTCPDTGQDYEEFSVPALDAAALMADAMARGGILFEEVPGSAFSKKRR